jgi:hypothetical protein
MVLRSRFTRSILDFFLMVAARSIVFAIFVPAATSAVMVIPALCLPAMLTRLFWHTGVGTLADGD